MARPLHSDASSAPSKTLSHTPFYSIEYPGYIAPGSVPRVLQRLGGDQTVTETFRRGLKIDLKLKDNAPFAHPVTGQAVTSHNLVLKVVRRKRRQTQLDRSEDVVMQTGSSQNLVPKGEFTAEVVGVIQKTIRFRSMLVYKPTIHT